MQRATMPRNSRLSGRALPRASAPVSAITVRSVPERRRRRAGARDFERERVTGIEPAFSAWEADVLPLNYTREEGQR
jgi:hypothetical protein